MSLQLQQEKVCKIKVGFIGDVRFILFIFRDKHAGIIVHHTRFPGKVFVSISNGECKSSLNVNG